jgi:Flp pilus assembly protein TadG
MKMLAEPYAMRFIDWLKQPPQWQDRAARYTDPGIVACYWDGTGQMAHPVKDVSLTGAYLYTSEPWSLGTMLAVTLRDTAECEGPPAPGSISVPCRVVRHGPDGVGVSFMLHSQNERKALERFLRATVHMRRARSALGLEIGTRGQALVEFALMVPFVFLLIFNAVNFGGFLYNWITISNAARVGAQYAAMGSAYQGYPSEATLAAIKTMIQNETASLPGASATNPAITICENQNGTGVAFPPVGSPPAGCAGGTPVPPQDPETITGVGGSTFTSVGIDITYTYTSFIPAFSSGALSVFVPPSPIHIRTVMRVLN